MQILRRTFITTMGAVAATALTLPAVLRGQTTSIQQKELDMEIKRISDQRIESVPQ